MSRVQFHSCYKFHFPKSPVLKFQFCQEPVTTPQISTHQFNRLLMAPENRWRWMTRFLACIVRRCAVENGHDLDLSVNHYRIQAGSVTRLCWSTTNDAISAEKNSQPKSPFCKIFACWENTEMCVNSRSEKSALLSEGFLKLRRVIE